jgi:hypothetical protein
LVLCNNASWSYYIFEYVIIVLFFSGFKPFVEACIDAGQKLEAVKYIVKLTNSAEKSEV